MLSKILFTNANITRAAKASEKSSSQELSQKKGLLNSKRLLPGVKYDVMTRDQFLAFMIEHLEPGGIITACVEETWH